MRLGVRSSENIWPSEKLYHKNLDSREDAQWRWIQVQTSFFLQHSKHSISHLDHQSRWIWLIKMHHSSSAKQRHEWYQEQILFHWLWGKEGHLGSAGPHRGVLILWTSQRLESLRPKALRESWSPNPLTPPSSISPWISSQMTKGHPSLGNLLESPPPGKRRPWDQFLRNPDLWCFNTS